MPPDDEQIPALIAGVRILSELFWGPNRQMCRDILAGTYFQPFTALENTLKFHPPDALQNIERASINFPNADSLLQYLETEYVRLFVSHRDGIAAPLYASCYFSAEAGGAAPLMGEPAISMQQCLEARGLSLDSNINEPPDHLAIELEFLYFLLEKGWSNKDRKLIEQASSFSSDSMLPWVTRFQKRLVDVETEGSFYLLITAVLNATLGYIGGVSRP